MKTLSHILTLQPHDLLKYFCIDYNISTGYFNQKLKIPDEFIVFWVTIFENSHHKVIFEKRFPSYVDVFSFIEFTTERNFLTEKSN